jgi:hypothetical protein
MRFRNTKQNLRNLCNLRMIAYEALLFPRCVSYSLDLAFLAILFPPLSFICVNLRSSAVLLRFHSRHFAISLLSGIYLRFAFIGAD